MRPGSGPALVKGVKFLKGEAMEKGQGMREIKFRVWNGECMSNAFHPWEMRDDRCGGFMDSKGVGLWYDGCEEDNLKWMQYTGLKDKNGVEIYEGDICRMVFSEDEGGGSYSHQTGVGKVYFNHYWGVKFDCRDKTQRIAAHWGEIGTRDWRKVEIIGNIHQHPELLKAQG